MAPCLLLLYNQSQCCFSRSQERSITAGRVVLLNLTWDSANWSSAQGWKSRLSTSSHSPAVRAMSSLYIKLDGTESENNYAPFGELNEWGNQKQPLLEGDWTEIQQPLLLSLSWGMRSQMSFLDSVKDQRETPSMPSLQDGSKKNWGLVENPKGASSRCGGIWKRGFHRGWWVGQKSGKKASALGALL